MSNFNNFLIKNENINYQLRLLEEKISDLNFTGFIKDSILSMRYILKELKRDFYDDIISLENAYDQKEIINLLNNYEKNKITILLITFYTYLLEDDNFELRIKILRSIFMILEVLLNTKFEFIDYEWKPPETFFFDDKNYDQKWKNIQAVSKEYDKFSHFIACYVLVLDNSDYKTNKVKIINNIFFDIFYCQTNNINEYMLNIFVNPTNQFKNLDEIKALIEKELQNNDKLKKFILERFDNSEELVISIFCKFLNQPKIKNFNIDILNINWRINCNVYNYSNLKDFLEDNEETIQERVSGVSLDLYDSNYILVENHKRNYKTIFAVVKASSINSLYNNDKNINNNIFDKNVREYIKNKQVDEAIDNTLALEPDNFLIYNNGLTIITSSVKISNNKINFGYISIVNGGQTTSALGMNKNMLNLEEASVFCKIIEVDLDSEGIEFIDKISINSNNQKPIKNIDYVSTLRPLVDFEKEFNSIDNEIELCIKRSDRRKKIIKNSQKIFLETTGLMQIIHSIFHKTPGKAKNSSGSLMKDPDDIKYKVEKLNLQTENNKLFFYDLIKIYKFFYRVINNDYKIENFNDKEIKIIPFCIYFWLMICVTLMYKESYGENLSFNNANKFLKTLPDDIIFENLIQLIKPIFSYVEDIVKKEEIEYAQVFKTEKYLKEIEKNFKKNNKELIEQIAKNIYL